MLALMTLVLVSTPPAVPGSPAEEIELALSAAPLSLRAEAGVYRLGDDGFIEERKSRNGFHCLVERGGRGTVEPVCWDAEGSETLLPAALEKARLRAGGMSEDAIDRRIADEFASGRLRVPRRGGVAYMLSPQNQVWNGERTIHYYPHIMVYAPYVTNADIGADRSSPWMPWVLNEGMPNAYIITVVRTDDDE